MEKIPLWDVKKKDERNDEPKNAMFVKNKSDLKKPLMFKFLPNLFFTYSLTK
jgi:hypothetical protein